jgi:hypothetical protein
MVVPQCSRGPEESVKLTISRQSSANRTGRESPHDNYQRIHLIIYLECSKGAGAAALWMGNMREKGVCQELGVKRSLRVVSLCILCCCIHAAQSVRRNGAHGTIRLENENVLTTRV